jgi:hypothetical protein
MAQVISRWLINVTAQVRAQVGSCGIYEDKAILEQVFWEYFSFS